MRSRSLKIVIALLVVASMACNYVLGLVPGQQAEPTPELSSGATAVAEASTPAPREAAFYDQSGQPVEYEPPPEELVDLLLEEVEAGEINLADGVLELMRLLAAEGDQPDYSQGVEGGTEFKSGWGLSLLAHQVYQQTEDPELRAELERLHRRFVPPPNALKQYAIPAEEYEASQPDGQPGLSKQIDCSEIWADGFPPSQGPAPTCLLFNGFQAGGYEYFVYHPVEMQADQAKMAYVQAAFQSLQDSQSTYSNFFEVRSIDVVFSPISASDIGGPAWGSAFVPALNANDMGEAACPITIVQGAFSYTVDQFKQIIAHEIFHCVSLWRKGFSGYTATDWYDEGMAEYFSNVVYPSINNEHGSVHKFHGASITQSIFEMSYENVVFFQYLANQFGNEWLIDLYDALPAESTQAMLGHMSSVPNMDAIFHDFARAYVDGKILDTNGSALPGQALFPGDKSYFLPADGSLTQEAKSFHIDRASILFEPVQQISLEITEDDTGDQSARLGGDQAWGTLPEEIATCDAPVSYVQVLTSTVSGAVGSTTTTLEVSVTEAEENDCDQCLVGVWQHDHATSEYWHHVMDASASRNTYLDQVSGTGRLVFFESGDYQTISEGLELVWINASVEDVVTQSISTVEGSASGKYFTYDGEELQMTQITNNYTTTVVTVVSGPLGTFTSDPMVSPEGSASLSADSTPYTCEGDTLAIHRDDPGWGWSGFITYTRVSDDPGQADDLGTAP